MTRRGFWRRSAAIPWTATAVAAAFTLVVVAIPDVRFAYDNLVAHVALETAEGLVAAVVAALCAGRSRRTGAVGDLVLACGFAALASTNLLVSAVPIAAAGDRSSELVTWLALALRLLGATALAVASVTIDRTTGEPGRRRALVLAAVGLLVAVVAAAAATAWLGPPIDPALSPRASNRPTFGGHPVVIVALVAGLVLYGAAAVGFARAAARLADDLLRWVAAGAAVAAVARIHYVLYPSLYSNWLYTGDLLRAASYGLFLTGAARALVGHWAALAQVAADDERRQLARELHDGLVQELSYIRSQTAGRASIPEAVVPHLAAAADRALRESRLALDALDDDPIDLAGALRLAAEGVAARRGAAVDVCCSSTEQVGAPIRHALLRVVREATTNAVNHGSARHVEIELSIADGTLVLRVADDGTGPGPSAPDTGFGLRSMRDRVGALGGTFRFGPAADGGAEVVAVLPLR